MTKLTVKSGSAIVALPFTIAIEKKVLYDCTLISEEITVCNGIKIRSRRRWET